MERASEFQFMRKRSVSGGRQDGLGFLWTFTLQVVIKPGECSGQLLIEGIGCCKPLKDAPVLQEWYFHYQKNNYHLPRVSPKPSKALGNFTVISFAPIKAEGQLSIVSH